MYVPSYIILYIYILTIPDWIALKLHGTKTRALLKHLPFSLRLIPPTVYNNIKDSKCENTYTIKINKIKYIKYNRINRQVLQKVTVMHVRIVDNKKIIYLQIFVSKTSVHARYFKNKLFHFYNLNYTAFEENYFVKKNIFFFLKIIGDKNKFYLSNFI